MHLQLSCHLRFFAPQSLFKPNYDRGIIQHQDLFIRSSLHISGLAIRHEGRCARSHQKKRRAMLERAPRTRHERAIDSRQTHRKIQENWASLRPTLCNVLSPQGPNLWGLCGRISKGQKEMNETVLQEQRTAAEEMQALSCQDHCYMRESSEGTSDGHRNNGDGSSHVASETIVRQRTGLVRARAPVGEADAIVALAPFEEQCCKRDDLAETVSSQGLSFMAHGVMPERSGVFTWDRRKLH